MPARPGSPLLPDWRDAAGYAGLQGAAPHSFAWEWLRRDSAYCEAARVSAGSARHREAGGGGSGCTIVMGHPSAAAWGLHAFEDPDLPAAAARPVWRRAVFPRTLMAAAEERGAAEDRFDLARFAAQAVVVRGDGGAEHVLLGDGRAILRLDIAAGSVLHEPVRLAYRLGGLVAIDGPLATLHGVVRLCRSGRLGRPTPHGRSRRLLLLLRACDALQAGATQREIAGVLLSPDAACARWRTEAPSLRLQAQRLARGARTMARGGYRSLLGA